MCNLPNGTNVNDGCESVYCVLVGLMRRFQVRPVMPSYHEYPKLDHVSYLMFTSLPMYGQNERQTCKERFHSSALRAKWQLLFVDRHCRRSNCVLCHVIWTSLSTRCLLPWHTITSTIADRPLRYLTPSPKPPPPGRASPYMSRGVLNGVCVCVGGGGVLDDQRV